MKTYGDPTVTYGQTNITYNGGSIFTRILTETISISENIIKSVSKTLTDTINKSDSIVKSFNKILSETISTTDTFSRTVQYFRTFTEILTASDSLRRLLNGVEQIWSSIQRTASTIFSKRTKPTTDWQKRDKPWD